ncbi:MAG: LCP family protein [Propionibacteriaceae bacterium]|nr:LCP family protein [Propionibacteriaceae bacterium]
MTESTGARRAAEGPRRKRGILTWLFTIVGAVVALSLIVGGFYVWRVWSTASDIERTQTLLPADDDPERPETGASGSFNYVLMGSDSRGEGDRGRSDVLMLAHVPPTRDKVYLVSFPRDMWVEIPGRGHAKINAAYAYGGDALATRTLESLVGVRMDHAAKINFEGFIGLTQELGGVTINNKVASSPNGYSFPRGELTLQGEEALVFVRERYGLPNGDLDRAERQRLVVKAILMKMLSRNVLTNPVTFNNVMSQLGQYFQVDDGLTNEVMFQTATSMRVNSGEDIVQLQAPAAGLGTSGDGQSIVRVNEAQLAEMAQAIRTGTMADYYAKYKDQPLMGR